MLEMQAKHGQFAGYWDDFKEPLPKVQNDYEDALIAIADPVIRSHIFQQWQKKAVPFNPLISEEVSAHASVKIGKGTIICPGVKMTVDITIGQFVIINLNATIGHDVRLGDFCSIMPSVNLSGHVAVEREAFIGTGATVLQGIRIGERAVIGAGAVVTKDVPAGATVIGVPAKLRT